MLYIRLLAASHPSPRKHPVHSFHSDQSAMLQHKCRRTCTTSVHFHVHVWSGHYPTDHIWCQVQLMNKNFCTLWMISCVVLQVFIFMSGDDLIYTSLNSFQCVRGLGRSTKDRKADYLQLSRSPCFLKSVDMPFAMPRSSDIDRYIHWCGHRY